MTVRREVAAALVALLAGGVLLLVAEPALGLVVLAGTGAAAMLQPRPRTAVAVVLVLAAIAITWLAWSREDVLLGAGAVLVVGGAGIATARSRRWPPPGRDPERERPRERGVRDTWEALDRGEDPTG